MIRYEFKACISNGRELYGFSEVEIHDEQWLVQKSELFPESLLSFLYMDLEQMRRSELVWLG